MQDSVLMAVKTCAGSLGSEDAESTHPPPPSPDLKSENNDNSEPRPDVGGLQSSASLKHLKLFAQSEAMDHTSDLPVMEAPVSTS